MIERVCSDVITLTDTPRHVTCSHLHIYFDTIEQRIRMNGTENRHYYKDSTQRQPTLCFPQ